MAIPPPRPLTITLLTITLLLCACSKEHHRRWLHTGGYHFSFQGTEASRTEQGPLPEGIDRVQVAHQFGMVAVEASPEETGWVWELRVWATDSLTAERLSHETRLAVERDGNSGKWRLVLPDPVVRDLRGVESKLTIKAPPGLAVDLANSFGATRVEGMEGAVTARCRHGALDLRDLAGAVDASTSFGPLRAERIMGGTLQNEHGPILALGVQGPLEARTRFGVIEVERISGDLTARNHHGAIKATAVSGKADLQTSFGLIEVDGASGGVLLKNQHGVVRCRGIRGEVVVDNRFGNVDIAADVVRADCTNEHGDITLALAGDDLRDVKARTQFGRIVVQIPEEVERRARVEAETSFGTVRAAWPLEVVETGIHRSMVRSGPVDAAVRLQLENRHGDILLRSGG